MVPNKRFWRILALLVASVLLPIIAMLIIDYRKTIGLRSRVDSLPIGTPENELLAALGAPDAVSQGSLMFERNVTVHGYTVWTYCSRFDWDGIRSRWNDASFVPYWFSRLSPTVDRDHDAVIELWIRNGKLEEIKKAVDADLIGHHPILSI